jgi:hypothetical protein
MVKNLYRLIALCVLAYVSFLSYESGKTIQDVADHLPNNKPTAKDTAYKVDKKIKGKESLVKKSEPYRHRKVKSNSLLPKHIKAEENKVVFFVDFDHTFINEEHQLTPLYLINFTDEDIHLPTVDDFYARLRYLDSEGGYVDAKNIEAVEKQATCGNSFFSINIPKQNHHLSYVLINDAGAPRRIQYLADYYVPAKNRELHTVESNQGIGYFQAEKTQGLSRTAKARSKVEESKFIRNVEDAKKAK